MGPTLKGVYMGGPPFHHPKAPPNHFPYPKTELPPSPILFRLVVIFSRRVVHSTWFVGWPFFCWFERRVPRRLHKYCSQLWIEDDSWMEERSKKYDPATPRWLTLFELLLGNFYRMIFERCLYIVYLHCFCLMSRGFSQIKNSEHFQECFLFGSA